MNPAVDHHLILPNETLVAKLAHVLLAVRMRGHVLSQCDCRLVRFVDANRTVVLPDVQVGVLHVGLQRLDGCVPFPTLFAGVLVGVDGLVVVQMRLREEGARTVETLRVRVGFVGVVRFDVPLQVGCFGVICLTKFANKVVHPLFRTSYVGLFQMHDLLVVVELMVVFELLLAFTAHVGVSAFMFHFHVVPKEKGSPERSAACCTDVRIFVRMDQHMPFETGFSSEAFFANITYWLSVVHVYQTDMGF